MGGDLARLGFRFQDLYLLQRMLRVRAETYRQTSLEAVSARFGVEGKSLSEADISASVPTWDVIIQFGTNLEVIEAKSGKISRKERVIFWNRLRKEHAFRSAPRRLCPVLVVDPDCVEGLDRWRQLPVLAEGYVAGGSIREPSSRVLTSTDLLDEAIWSLTKVEAGGGDQAMPLSAALELLSRLRVDSWVAEDLETAVLESIELLFADGITSQIRDLFLGWLGGRAVVRDHRRRFFTMAELLDEMNVRQFCASLSPSTLTEWRSLWADLPNRFNARVRSRLGKHGVSIALDDAQPDLVSALSVSRTKVRLLTGQAGAGKTNALAQCAQRAENLGAEVFCSPADALNESDLEVLARSLRFRRALSATVSPDQTLWIGIDGLDEVDGPLRERWAQHLCRIALHGKTMVVATVREATWHADPRLRHHFQDAEHSSVKEWPLEKVRSLLAPFGLRTKITPTLLELLRQPLFLDLFWRTFVECNSASDGNYSTTETRHGLLTAFWQERVLNSYRQRNPNLFSCLENIIQRAANNVGGFFADGLDQDSLTLMQSESVMVPEGSLIPRIRFRHPLLRDFAFALWCLRASTPLQVVERWQTIRGGIQRQGALRAILEAMLGAHAETEFPNLNIGELFDAFLSGDAQTASRLAQLIGTMPATPILDPALWPGSVRDALPPMFGRELLISARVAVNGSWAERIVRWTLTANWLDAEFAQEIYNYTDCLRRIAEAEPANFAAKRLAQQAARKLRSTSEHPRFTKEFEKHGRWLKAMTLCVIVPLLPDHDTIACWEREMPMASGRTREFPLDQLIHMAGVDPKRAAEIYRSAVGLIQTPAGPRLDPAEWHRGGIDHHAINWSLDGEGQRRSLLTEHPKEFFPVAIDLAVALMHTKKRAFNIALEQDGLQDDLPAWNNFWNSVYDDSFDDRCLRVIHKKAKEVLGEHPEVFFDVVCSLLASSRSTAIYSIYLDLIIHSPENADCAAAARRCLFDTRVYRAKALSHWLETALVRYWPDLTPSERSQVLGYIEAAADASPSDPASDYRRAQLLANLPLSDLPLPHQRAVAASLITRNHHITEHPARFFQEMSEAVFEDEDNDLDMERSRGWPTEFDHSALQTLSKTSRILVDRDVKTETVAENLPPAIVAVQSLLPAFEQAWEVLTDHERDWAWYGLEASVNMSLFKKVPDLVPPDELLFGCAHFALKILEVSPTLFHFEELADDLYRSSNNAWVRALHLADAALVWPPLLRDATIQSRFERILRDAFATEVAAIQAAVVDAIRPFHWVHNEARRKLQDELIWSRSRHNLILIMSLRRLGAEMDGRRSDILRLLLHRHEVECNAKELASTIGHWLGHLAVYVPPSGERTTTATLLEEILDDPQRWPLLRSPTTRSEVFRNVAFEMKEYVQDNWSRTELAADFASWNQSIWQHLRAPEVTENPSDHIVLYALHWLEQKHQEPLPSSDNPPPPDPATLRTWWEHLLPLWHSVVDTGHQGDVHTIFFAFGPRLMNHIVRSEEVLKLVESLISRLQLALETGHLMTEQLSDERVAHHSWLDVLQRAVAAIDALRQDGLLRTDLQREYAERTLRRLSAPPFRITESLRALHQLQADET